MANAAEGVEEASDINELLEGEGVASIIDPVIDPAIMPDPITTLEQGHLLPDLQYQRSRPILFFQLLFIFGLIFLKYGTYFTQTKLKGFQVKLFGSLLLC